MIYDWPTGPVRIDIERISLDCCEVCKLQLYPSERVEVLVSAPAFDNEFGGFSAVFATYCKDHAPEEAP